MTVAVNEKEAAEPTVLPIGSRVMTGWSVMMAAASGLSTVHGTAVVNLTASLVMTVLDELRPTVLRAVLS